MPGVPSSRGCDACRRQKKKVIACSIICEGSSEKTANIVDLQCADKAPCPRCQRLGIECVGLGQQRYKFKNKIPDSTTTTESGSHGAVSKALDGSLPLKPARCPSNTTTILTSSFIDKINVFVDIRYQLLGNFGGYLAEIPCRLGTNAALDAASDTLVAAHARFCSGNRDPDRALLAKHSQALSILRHSLDSSVNAHSSETLCAIMLLMIVQVL